MVYARFNEHLFLFNKPVYPRPHPEYEKTMREQFLHRMKNMRWDDPEECYCKPRGRKPEQVGCLKPQVLQVQAELQVQQVLLVLVELLKQAELAVVQVHQEHQVLQV